VLSLCVEAVDAEGGTIYLHDPTRSKLQFRHVLPSEVAAKLQATEIDDDFGVAGQAFQTRSVVITTPSVDSEPEARAEIERATNVRIRTMLTAPLMVAGTEPIGVVQLINKRNGTFNQQDLAVIETVGAVSAMAYTNSALREQANRAASLMGMGKVSHDIGNLAAALLSSLMLVEPAIQAIESEGSASKELEDYAAHLRDSFTDLKESIDRIVGYSRLISDISAGRPVRPTLRAGNFPQTVLDAASYLEPEARRSGVRLVYDVDPNCQPRLFDTQFVFRIVQNLVGNAIKAVKESAPVDEREDAEFGTVWVRCSPNGTGYVLEVQDSGPGLREDTVRRILAGNATSQWETSGGSGWGTKIVLELASALGGHLDIASTPGEGATFRVSIPSESLEKAAAAPASLGTE
jgi:signal transduction histidine kinase